MTGSLSMAAQRAADALPGAGPTWLVTHLAIDAAAMAVLVWWIFRRRHRDLDAPLVLIALNLGLFAALACIASGEFSAGIGFGLFGMLSLVRLRSEAFSSSEMAYTFVALVIALINGLPGRETWLPLLLTVLLVAVVAVVDHPRLRPRTRRIELTLDRAYSSPDLVRGEVAVRLKATVLDVNIREVDYVREITRVAVRYLVDPPRRERRVTVAAPAGPGAPAEPVGETTATYGRAPYPTVSGMPVADLVDRGAPVEQVIDVRYGADRNGADRNGHNGHNGHPGYPADPRFDDRYAGPDPAVGQPRYDDDWYGDRVSR